MATQKKHQKLVSRQIISLNAGQKYCRMLLESILHPREHSAILLTFIKLPFVIKTFVLSIFEWMLKTVFTVYEKFNSSLVLVQPRKTRPYITGRLLEERKESNQTNK